MRFGLTAKLRFQIDSSRVDSENEENEMTTTKIRDKEHGHEPLGMNNGRAGTTRNILTVLGVVGLLFSLTAGAQNRQSTNAAKIEPLPRDLEIQLALSALPPQLRDNATVYVLNLQKGFEVARKGTNGFHAFVARTGDDAMQGTWPLTKYRDDILYPVSFDSAGAKANMRGFFDIAEQQAQGTPPEQLKKLIQERYKTGYYKPPAAAGCSYMLSPILRTYVNPDAGDTIVTASVPHVMCYAPNVTTQDIGVVPTPDELHDFTQHGHWSVTPSPFVIHQGSHGYMVHIRGVSDRTAIDQTYREMLARLCNLKDAWCLLDEPGESKADFKAGK
jgi:hypothetical protein